MRADHKPDLARAQELRDRCRRVLAGHNPDDVVGALELLIADCIVALPGVTQSRALGGAAAVAGDVRNIITERFLAMQVAAGASKPN